MSDQFMGDFSRQLKAFNRATDRGRSTDDDVGLELFNQLAPRLEYDDALTRDQNFEGMVERVCDWGRSIPDNFLQESGVYLWPLVQEAIPTTATRQSRVMLAIVEHMLVNGVMQCPQCPLTTWGVPRFQSRLPSFEEFQPRSQTLFDGQCSSASGQISVAIWLATVLKTDPCYATLVDRLASVFQIPVPTATDHSETEDDTEKTKAPAERKASADAPADVEKTQVTGEENRIVDGCRCAVVKGFVIVQPVSACTRSRKLLPIKLLPN
jgi:hypothetical protein